jgi:hypothetical protein
MRHGSNPARADCEQDNRRVSSQRERLPFASGCRMLCAPALSGHHLGRRELSGCRCSGTRIWPLELTVGVQQAWVSWTTPL